MNPFLLQEDQGTKFFICFYIISEVFIFLCLLYLSLGIAFFVNSAQKFRISYTIHFTES